MNEDAGNNEKCWRDDPEWSVLYELIKGTVARDSAKHPGIIAEEIVEAVRDRYDIGAREVSHRERRTNHHERIRRLSHSVFRMLDPREVTVPTEKITAGVMKAFVLFRRRDGKKR